MLSLRCRLLQYAVSLASMVGMATTFFRYFLFHVMASSFLSSSEGEMRQLLEEKDLKCIIKAIIGFGFCDMQNYQSLGKSYLTRLRLG